MSDIELVIKIPEDEYNIAKYGQYGNINVDVVRKAIADGTPLPEHHGRFIDADALESICNADECGMLTSCNHCQYHIVTDHEIDNAPTVIEADKEGENEADS